MTFCREPAATAGINRRPQTCHRRPQACREARAEFASLADLSGAGDRLPARVHRG